MNSGAYYGYNLHQILLLFTFNQRRILVTVSKQVDVSTVGRKGYTLGSDSDWDYIYSGKTGLTLPALGWVKSYMYDSRSINIYDEMENQTHWQRMSKAEMESAMFIEYMKYTLGKSRPDEVRELLGLKQ